MFPIIRDTSLGQTVRFLSTGNLLKYPDELHDFELPDISNEKHKPSNETGMGIYGASSTPTSDNDAEDGKIPQPGRNCHLPGSTSTLFDGDRVLEASDDPPRVVMEASPKGNEEVTLVSWYNDGMDCTHCRGNPN